MYCNIVRYMPPNPITPAGNLPTKKWEYVIDSTVGAINVLATGNDVTGATISAAPNNLNNTGGWIVGSSPQCLLPSPTSSQVGAAGGNSGNQGGASFNAITAGLPKVVPGSEPAPWAGPGAAALRLTTGTTAGCAVHADSAIFAVTTGKTYVLKVLVRSTSPAAAGVLQINASFYKWAPPAQALHGGAGALQPSSVLPQTTVLLRAASTFTLGLWEQMMVLLPTPFDGAFASIRIAVAEGAVVDLYALTIA